MRVFTFLAEGFEEVEALAVTDVLIRAGMNVDLVSTTKELTVEGAHGIEINAKYLLSEMKDIEADLLFLPGGMPGTTNLGNHPRLSDMLIKANQNAKRIAAICAAPSVLGKLGILKGKKATCFPGFEDSLEGAEIILEKVVVDGNIITSRGMGTAIDLGLKLVNLFYGEELETKIAKNIQYL